MYNIHTGDFQDKSHGSHCERLAFQEKTTKVYVAGTQTPGVD